MVPFGRILAQVIKHNEGFFSQEWTVIFYHILAKSFMRCATCAAPADKKH